jgi:Lon protease-like protein
MNEQVLVQFKQAFPVVSLPETLLLPHSFMPITVTEPKYNQLTNQVLDSSGQVALASFVDNKSPRDHAQLKKIVCLGQIVQHEKIEEGYNLMLYGLCRAEIIQENPANADRLYRTVLLRQIENKDERDDDLEIYRVELLHYMFRPNMEKLEQNETILDWVSESTITTSALFELVACSVFNDSKFRYALLSEPSSEARCLMVLKELEKLDRSISVASKQSQDRWDKGISLN